MGPLGVVEVDPFADDPFGLEAIRQFVEVFERPPGSLDEDVIHAAAPAVLSVVRMNGIAEAFF
jgi:hypothetical protein